MNNKSILKNIGVSMIAKPIGMLLMFIYTPMVLAFLGEEKYGVWAIILNIISWINYFDIGIGNGLRNKLAEAFAKEEKENSQMLVSTAYFATIIVSLIFCILLICVWSALDLSHFFNLNINGENVDRAVIVSIVFVCINFVLSLSRTIMYAIQKSGLVSVMGVEGQALQIFVLLIVSYVLKESIMAVAIIYGGISLSDNIILKMIIDYKYKYLKPQIKKIDLSKFKSLMSLGIGFFVMQICTLVLNTTDNLLISKLFGAIEVTTYDIVYKVFYMFIQVHAIVIMPMWSAYTAAIARSDINWIKKTMKKVNLVTVVLSLGVFVAIFMFEPFASLWLGKSLNYGEDLIILVALYMILQMISNNYSSFLCGAGEIREASALAVIGAIVNIPLSVFFSIKMEMGLSGIILGSLVVMAMNVIIFPIVTRNWIKNAEKNL